jgi:hypothetical protein
MQNTSKELLTPKIVFSLATDVLILLNNSFMTTFYLLTTSLSSHKTMKVFS